MGEDILVKREITLEADAETLRENAQGRTRKRLYRLLRRSGTHWRR